MARYDLQDARNMICSAYLDWTKQNWPDVYNDYVRGKF